MRDRGGAEFGADTWDYVERQLERSVELQRSALEMQRDSLRHVTTDLANLRERRRRAENGQGNTSGTSAEGARGA